MHRDLLRSEDERRIFSCERHEWVCEMSEVLDEDSNYSDGDEEGLYFREVFAWAPVDNFVDS